MKRQLGLLVAGTVMLWLVIAYPAQRLWGEAGLVQSATAMLLCLAPGVLTLVFSSQIMASGSQGQLLAALGGTGVRMVVVLGVGFLLYSSIPDLHTAGFWLWIAVFYVSTLAMEVGLLANSSRHAPRDGPSSRGA